MTDTRSMRAKIEEIVNGPEHVGTECRAFRLERLFQLERCSDNPNHTELRAVAEAAKHMWESNDDGHRCGSGDECTSCELRGALDRLVTRPEVKP